jgi:FlaA1/EpsC-like NDP-sugar epimerase
VGNNILKVMVTWLFALESWQKRLILLGFDSFVIPLSVLLALAARLESHDFLYQIDSYIACVVAFICSMALFFARGFYNAFTRHITIDTAFTIIVAAAASALVLLALISFGSVQIPRSVPFIQAAFSVVGIASLRFFIRAIGQNINRAARKNITIYGAGMAGRQLVEALKWNSQYRVCQIIDDDPKLHGQSLGGVKIEGFDAARKKLTLYEIDTILLAMSTAPFEVHQRIFDLLTESPVKVKSIPDLTSLIAGTADITELRDIDIVDLLGRDPTEPDPQLLGKTIIGKTVLVTGAGGSIGSELCRQIVAQAPAHMVILDISEFAIYSLLQELEKTHPSVAITPLIGSVQDQPFVAKVLGRFAIDTIYHAAAYKHVPLMEQNVMQCITNNVFGTRITAAAAVAAQVKHFILVSTDKAVNPTNFMGASKRLAELVCQDFARAQHTTKFAIVRFGNVLGSSGSVVPLFKQQIAAGGPVTVTHADVIRYFMTIPEAAQLVIQAGSLAKRGGIFVLDMGKPVKILDLAKKMIILSGKKPLLETERTAGAGEIAISITGLRPGEKMFEELSYSDNLIGTAHPRIMTTDDSSLSGDNLKALLDTAFDAIAVDDHQKLFKIVRQVCKGVTSDKTSSDVFYNNLSTRAASTVISLSTHTKS